MHISPIFWLNCGLFYLFIHFRQNFFPILFIFTIVAKLFYITLFDYVFTLVKIGQKERLYLTEQYYIEMGRRIKLRRKELNISQTKLAELIDVSNNHMSNIENAKTKPSMDNFIKLCEILKVTPDYLLLGSIYSNNISKNIHDKLLLCSEEDVKLADRIIELLVNRNHTKWNKDNFV